MITELTKNQKIVLEHKEQVFNERSKGLTNALEELRKKADYVLQAQQELDAYIGREVIELTAADQLKYIHANELKQAYAIKQALERLAVNRG
jgi:hypothetical protein